MTIGEFQRKRVVAEYRGLRGIDRGRDELRRESRCPSAPLRGKRHGIIEGHASRGGGRRGP